MKKEETGRGTRMSKERGRDGGNEAPKWRKGREGGTAGRKTANTWRRRRRAGVRKRLQGDTTRYPFPSPRPTPQARQGEQGSLV